MLAGWGVSVAVGGRSVGALLLGFCRLVANESALEKRLCLFYLASLVVMLCDGGRKAGSGRSKARDKDLKDINLTVGTQSGPSTTSSGERATGPG